MVLAQDEARAFKHNYIGTEHLLLGLLREEEGLAARVLESLDVTVEEVREQVARIVGQGDEITSGQIPFTPRSKKVLELALREALSLGHNYIGTEHILLGLVRENEGVAARILLDFDADAEKIRNEIIRMLSGPGRRRAVLTARRFSAHRRPTPAQRRPGSTGSSRGRPRSRMRRTEQLDELGADGWQLAAVVPGGELAGMGLHAPAHGVSVVDRGHRRRAGPRRALTVGQVESALADAQEAALEALGCRSRDDDRGARRASSAVLIQRVVDAVEVERGRRAWRSGARPARRARRGDEGGGDRELRTSSTRHRIRTSSGSSTALLARHLRGPRETPRARRARVDATVCPSSRG